MFIHATAKIKIEGTEVIPFPLFEVLDGSNSGDYEQRVEPSPQGGQKMAKALMDAVMTGQREEERATTVDDAVEGSPLIASESPVT